MGVHREHNAADVYPRWKATIAAADHSIVIFTPYFDALLERLIKAAPVEVTVVTDLSPQSGAQDYLGQLHAISRMLTNGIDVRHLNRLHAKVLWVDDGTVVYGSQNFTRYARKSKEASTSPVADLTGTAFTSTLRTWLTDSTRIDAALIHDLLQRAQEPAEEVKAAHARLQETVHDVVTKHTRARHQRRTFSSDRLRHATQRTRGRLAHGTARVKMTTAGTIDSGYYPTLMADSTTDLTRWHVSAAGKTKMITLDALYQYPLIEQHSGLMTWARIGSTRITYVHDSVKHGNYLSTPTFNDVIVATRFPQLTEATNHNVTWTFTPQLFDQEFTHLKVTIHALFDGESLTVAGEPVVASDHTPDAFAAECLSQFDEKNIDDFLNEYFTRFRYGPGHLGRDRHNVRDFFLATAYDLHLVMLRKVPVLVAEQIF